MNWRFGRSRILGIADLVANLPPSATGYVVCFDGRNAVFGAAGYLPECWQDQPWDGTV